MKLLLVPTSAKTMSQLDVDLVSFTILGVCIPAIGSVGQFSNYSMFVLYVVLFAITVIALRILLRYNIKICSLKNKMNGKVMIVTGANSGIGFHTAKDLAERGARVILACRNERRGITARNEIISLTGNHEVVYKNLDLASLESVRRFSEDIISTERRLDVLVNNAGVIAHSGQRTADGIIEEMQVNYFAPFLLTELLLPLLKKSSPSRIVNLGSLVHYIGHINVDTINLGRYSRLMMYANSKLCNMAFTVELAKRLQGTGVIVNAVHPGVVYTNILSDNSWMSVLFIGLCWFCYRSAWEGAQSVVGLCIEEECSTVNGKFYVDGAQWPIPWSCYNKACLTDLWRLSEQLVEKKWDGGSKTIQ